MFENGIHLLGDGGVYPLIVAAVLSYALFAGYFSDPRLEGVGIGRKS